MRQYLDFLRHIRRRGARKDDRTGTGNLERIRPPDALRSRAGISAGNHQENAPALHHPRTAVVPHRRHQCRLSARARRQHLGRMGGPRRKSGAGVRQAMAQLARGRRPHHRSIIGGGAAVEEQSEFPAHPGERLECGRIGADGAAALPRAVPVLRGRRPAVLPAVPAQRRRAAGRAVQYRLLRAAHAHAGTAMRSRPRRAHLDGRRLPSVFEPPGAGRSAAEPHAVSAAEAPAAPPAAQPVRLFVRGFRGPRLPPSRSHQGPPSPYEENSVPPALVRSAPLSHSRIRRVRRAPHPQGHHRHRIPGRPHQPCSGGCALRGQGSERQSHLSVHRGRENGDRCRGQRQ